MEEQVLDADWLAWNLSTRRIGQRFYAYESADSTMDIAQRLAAGGEPEGSVVVAEGQSRGRGRLGRGWLSPKGKGIYASVILRPPLSLAHLPRITLMAAVAVARAVWNQTGLEAGIKWPNDLMIRGRKMAGILTEMSGELNRVNFVVLGIGLNVNSSKKQLPAHATSLAEECGGRVDRLALARALFTELDQVYEEFLTAGFDPILKAWRQRAFFLGHRVRVMAEGRVVDGQAVDVDPSGALLVRTDTGIVESVAAGEVLVVR